ncbi:serine hydrolase domain-containing protein [Pollutibacter soli]|uniref:serine hydrolase domain-containing protein n=1 Tax=Pollutibacter soli TaxID=3034157 RepID=UPI003013A953
MRFLFFVIAVFSFSSCYSQTLKDEISSILSKYKIPGISLAYIQNGKVSQELSLGKANKEKGQNVTTNTVFSAASLSKPVFAYAVMQMADKGQIHLDTPLYKYFTWPDIAYDPRNKQITARMVLSHTSGLPNWRKRNDTLRFQYEPGTRFRYSGEGYVYLSKVVEKITGQPIEEYMQATIFQPLGMTRSGYIWRKSFEPDFGVPHNDDGDAEENYFPESANLAASLQTTASDYAKFLIALMNSRNLSANVYKEMFTPQPLARMQKTGDELFWALGLASQHTKEGLAFWQWGDNGNWKAFVMIYPDRKEGLVYFTNSTRGMDAASEILSLFFKGKQPSLEWLRSL